MKTESKTIVISAATAALICFLSASPASADPKVELNSISSRPDAISGGDVLVRLKGGLRESGGMAQSGWEARLDGVDVTASFRKEGQFDQLVALLHGLKIGKNLLEVRVGGIVKADLELINHPIEGPVFSGPHQLPFVCQTEINGLGPALDADCNAAARVQYYYKSTQMVSAGFWETAISALQEISDARPMALPVGFKQYDSERPPTDIAQTQTWDGQTVPYIVRREVGVINRAVYDIRFLHQPGLPLPTPWGDRPAGWNGRLVYELAGGCGPGYTQGTLLAPASHEAILARGYAVVTSTLNRFATNCNDVLSAETLSMVKEHFIKRFGEPAHTIGWGESGGAMQLHLIAQDYPGLLDGIIPYISFPDVVSTMTSITDCGLLRHVVDNSALHLSDEQKTAVFGFATWRTCATWGGPPPMMMAAASCPPSIAKSAIYDAHSNPKGWRCDLYDNEINVFGRDPRTGFARRPLDNVGVQYGLAAFNAGAIDAGQFVELNEGIGGYDPDGQFSAARSEAAPETIRNAYRSGVVMTAGGGLSQVPIIDWRWYSDDLADNHDSFRSFVTRERLIAAHGNAANQVIMIDPRTSQWQELIERLTDPNPETSLVARRERDLVGKMDRWLDAIAADTEPGSRAAKIVRDRPADVVDTCWTADGEQISGEDVYGRTGRCSQLYPRHADPRIVAGQPLTDDYLKCMLKPISLADYTHPLTNEQINRLEAAFPSGVCDFTRPGVGQELSAQTWQRFGPGAESQGHGHRRAAGEH